MAEYVKQNCLITKNFPGVARCLKRMGINTIPLSSDLKPALEYQRYLTKEISENDITNWERDGKYKNLAIVCGVVSGITCVDVDNLELFKKTFRSADLLINSCKFKERTKSGGLHLYFKYNPFVDGRSVQKSVFGVDILNYGLSFCFPSSCPEGSYELIEAVELKDMPEEFIREFNQRKRFKHLPELIELLQDIYTEGFRQNINLFLSGFLKKMGHPYEKTEELFDCIWEEVEPTLSSDERKQRISAIKNTYKKDTENIKGIAGLQDIATEVLGIEAGTKWTERLAMLFNYKPVDAITTEELQTAKALLRDPELLDKIVEHFNLSYIAREKEKKLLYLICLFTKLNFSTIVVVTGETSSGKSSLIETITSAFPDDIKMAFTATSERFFLYLNRPIHNKILTIFEINGATALPFLKTFITEGKASIGSVVKIRGELHPVEIQKDTRGLVLITTTTKQNIDEETANRGFVLEIETPPELVKQILKQKQALKPPNFKVLQILFKLLEPASVEIPYLQSLAERFAYDKPRRLRDFDKIVSLIKSHALLYQHQRSRNERGEIIASIDDYRAIYNLSDIIIPAFSELTQKQEEFLTWLKPHKSKTEIKEYWKSGKASRKSVFLWLKKLIENGFVEEGENSYTVLENLKNKFIGLPEPNIIYPVTQLHKPTQSPDNSCFKQCKTPITPDYTLTPEVTNVCNCVNGCKTTFTQHKANNINTLSDAVTLCNEENNTNWLDELEEF
jgi:energy-coupling factor transporter ATP-binding protein EcfA2